MSKRWNAPMYVGRHGGPGDYSDAWYWECLLPECEHELGGPEVTQVNDDATGCVYGSDGWSEAVRQGLTHLHERHAT